jgi:hypothetical protein
LNQIICSWFGKALTAKDGKEGRKERRGVRLTELFVIPTSRRATKEDSAVCSWLEAADSSALRASE